MSRRQEYLQFSSFFSLYFNYCNHRVPRSVRGETRDRAFSLSLLVLVGGGARNTSASLSRSAGEVMPRLTREERVFLCWFSCTEHRSACRFRAVFLCLDQHATKAASGCLFPSLLLLDSATRRACWRDAYVFSGLINVHKKRQFSASFSACGWRCFWHVSDSNFVPTERTVQYFLSFKKPWINLAIYCCN